MTSKLKDLFNESHDLASFEKSVVELDGSFDFDQSDMLSLGEAYLYRFPDRKKNRNSEEVRFGYRIARVCITESMLNGLPVSDKTALRKGFRDLSALAETVKKITEKKDPGECAELLEHLKNRIEVIQNTVNTLPKGLVRERFTGALSTSFNYLYLFRLLLNQNGTDI